MAGLERTGALGNVQGWSPSKRTGALRRVHGWASPSARVHFTYRSQHPKFIILGAVRGLKALGHHSQAVFRARKNRFLLFPWLLTCKKRGKSAQNEIGPKSGFPVLTRRQSAFCPILSGVS